MYYREKLLCELSKKYKSEESVIAEIARLSSELSLSKGTEHFMSDIHGEYEAFSHICRNASGVIRRKIDMLFSHEMNDDERAELASLIYYPKEKLARRDDSFDAHTTIIKIIKLLSVICEKYTQDTVRERIKSECQDYAELIFELIFTHRQGDETRETLIRAITRLGGTNSFIVALSRAVRALVIDRWHIVGDIFDRGARADIVIDELMRMPSVDIEWGNHDVLWLGASAGSPACIATAISNSLSYGNIELLERGYGISLSPLMQLADKYYSESEADAFMPRANQKSDAVYADRGLIARMNKAISIIRYKLEGALIHRHPEYLMQDRIMLERVDFSRCEIDIDGKKYALSERFFPTVDADSPLKLNLDEQLLVNHLVGAFSESDRLKRQAKFLLSVGGMYKIYNRNLLFHGCIPLDEGGDFLALDAAGGLSGRALMDECESRVRSAFSGDEEALDFTWFLWCGRNSPLSARERITSFERQLVSDKSTYTEKKNPYYKVWNSRELAVKILNEFSLPPHSHIINGHIPVKRGENPIKADGRVIVIDGGFSAGFHCDTAAAGYTLIYNADGMRLAAHKAFPGKERAILENRDIHSDIWVFEKKSRKISVRELDAGDDIRARITDLIELLELYRGNG
ncbi:MAG: fructose-bisphosphatase class III [Clostridia bacterium]|nr:fructose-bisphosphatase class III [Clostridia bacterium]